MNIWPYDLSILDESTALLGDEIMPAIRKPGDNFFTESDRADDEKLVLEDKTDIEPLPPEKSSKQLFKSIKLGRTDKVAALIQQYPELLNPAFIENSAGESAFLYSLNQGQIRIAWTLFNTTKWKTNFLIDRGRKEIPLSEATKRLPSDMLDLTKNLSADEFSKEILEFVKKSPEKLLESISSIEFASNPEATFDLHLHAINKLKKIDTVALSRSLKILILKLLIKESIEMAQAIFIKCSEYISDTALWEVLIEVVKMGICALTFRDLINAIILKRKATHELKGEYFYLFLKQDCIIGCVNFYQLSRRPSALANEIREEFIAQNMNDHYKIDLNIWKKLMTSSEGSKTIAPYLLTCLQSHSYLLSLRDEDKKTVFQLNREAAFEIEELVKKY